MQGRRMATGVLPPAVEAGMRDGPRARDDCAAAHAVVGSRSADTSG